MVVYNRTDWHCSDNEALSIPLLLLFSLIGFLYGNKSLLAYCGGMMSVSLLL